MAPKYFGSLSLLALVGAALAGPAIPEPTVTDPAVLRDGISPVPTDGPHHDLVKRDSAFYDTCGWISSSRTMSCNGLNTCAFVTSGSFSLQGCCDGLFGLSLCNFPTTCYDYAAYTGGGCGINCQLNSMNVVCSDSLEPSCRYYQFPNGASGFGCNTIGGTVTVTSVSGTTTALVPTAGADQFASQLSSSYGYSYSYPTYSTHAYSTFGSSGSIYDPGYGSSVAAVTAPLAVGVIAVIVVFGVGYGCWYIAAAVVIFMMCKRSKRLTAAWDQPGGANYRGPAEGSNVVGAYTAAAAVPVAASTPTMSPAPSQPAAGYYAGAAEAKGVSPQQTAVSPVYAAGSPAPTYTAANVSPYQNGGQPAQTYAYSAQQQQQQQQYHEVPAPVHQAHGQQPAGNSVSELM